jgi:hypothetical protein
MFDVTVSDCTVRLHLKNLGLTCQKPEYQDEERDEGDIEYFLNVKYPKIQRLASRIGADIGFQDESGVGIMTRYGRTWGQPCPMRYEPEGGAYFQGGMSLKRKTGR